MRLFLAAMFTAGFTRRAGNYRYLDDRQRQHREDIPNVLESYHYVKSDRITKDIRDEGRRVFLDSGAFSDFTLGKKTNLQDYADYINRNSDIIEYASVLDGIGDPQETLENQQALEKMGCNVLPCFHYGEPFSYLEHYINNYEYITLGGMVPISTPNLKVWLDDVFGRYLTHEDGSAKRKVHGFGLTTMSLVERYPWYSVDSSSWIQTGRTGGVHLPGVGAVQVSESSPSIKEAGRHYASMTPYEQGILDEAFESRGYSAELLSGNFFYRFAFNGLTYTEEDTRLNKMDLRFVREQDTLF